jgi:hypothetical protein
MPKTDRAGRPVEEELPRTLQRSDDKAQRTSSKAHDSALDGYDGDEQWAHRVGYAAFGHTHEKVGDHWEPKPGGRRGPSDEQAEGGVGTQDRRDTHGGVDANASKEHLYERAKQLGVRGRSRMTKDELVTALERANDRETRRARGS